MGEPDYVLRRLAAFVLSFVLIAETAGCGLGISPPSAVVALAMLLAAAPAVLAVCFPWRSRPDTAKRWRAVGRALASLRAGLAVLREQWQLPPLGVIWDRMSFKEARRLVRIRRERELAVDDIPQISDGQRQQQIYSGFKYNVDENFFLMRAIVRSVWSSLVPLYVADALLQAMDMFEIVLDGYILHCLDASVEHTWYQGHVAALVMVALKVSRSRIDDALKHISSGWSRVADALEIEFVRLPLTNTGLRKARDAAAGMGSVHSLLQDMRRIQSMFISVAIVATSAWSVYRQVGWLAVVPFGVPFVISLLNTGFAALTGNCSEWSYGGRGRSFNDSRIYGISRSIRTVKLFGWERLFLDPSLQQDGPRIRALPWYAPAVRAAWFVIDSVDIAASQISAGMLVYTYARTRSGSTAKAITNADLFRINGLVEHMRGQIEQLVWTVRNLQALLRRYNRIERFLRGDFVPTLPRTPELPAGHVASIRMDKCAFTWGGKRSVAPVLRNISLSADSGELVAVVGKTGSGKTSLLLAACSELEMTEGTGRVAGSIAYLEQSPWIMNDSMRANVLFGREYDQPLYERVIRACAFADDLAAWPDGDMTIIGDRGINISGGQRARLALARTLYSQADIYILDDPLSAVDAHVKRHILEHVILDSGLLAGKLRIISTHTKHIVPFSHQIVTLDDGRASATKQTPQAYRPVSAPLRDVAAAADATPAATGDEESDSDSDESTASDKGAGLQKWSLRENLGYIVRLCGLPAIAVVMMTGLIAPISSFIMDGYVLDALRADSDSVGGDVAGMLHYISLTMASDVVERIVLQARRHIDNSVIEKYLRQRLRVIFVRSLVNAPLSLFDSTTQGQITSAYDEGVGQVASDIVTLLLHDFGSAIRTMLSLYRIGSTSPTLLLALPPIAWISLTRDAWIRPAIDSVHDVQYAMVADPRDVNGVINSGKRMIRLFGVESYFIRQRMELNDRESRVASARNGLYALSSASYDFVNQLGKAAVMCTLLVQAQAARVKLSSGEYLRYQMLVDSLIGNMDELMEIPNEIHSLTNNINVFRRFASMEPECPCPVATVAPPANWPPRGKIEFRDFCMKYREDLSPALSNINLTIHPGEKVGIVGRTGAGKSSLIKALFRLHPRNTSGSIVIDGIDIASIGLADLRPRLGIIPQESTLIPGSLRENLDPLAEFTIEDMWAALIRCNIARLAAPPRDGKTIDENDMDSDADDDDGLYSEKSVRARKKKWAQAGMLKRLFLYMIDEMPDSQNHGPSPEDLCALDQDMSDRSASLSSGQQQLFSLCRLIMRRRRIVVLDEATADLDLATDRDMHSLIDGEFSDCTVLTIAHRLETVMSSDRIIVMDKGEIVEVGPPQELKERGGLFARLVQDDDFGQ